MSTPFFVAETSRAGTFGHRFILPPGHAEESSLAAKFCQYASRDEEGKNFIGVTQVVRQQLPNGAVRQGVETLVLVGVDYAGLNNEQQEHLKAVLSRRLADLDTLVTQRIDWEREGESLVVTRQELHQWVSDDHLLHFSSASVSTGPLTKRWKLRISPVIVVACVLVLGVGAVVGKILSNRKSLEEPGQQTSSKTKKNQFLPDPGKDPVLTALKEPSHHRGESQGKETTAVRLQKKDGSGNTVRSNPYALLIQEISQANGKDATNDKVAEALYKVVKKLDPPGAEQIKKELLEDEDIQRILDKFNSNKVVDPNALPKDNATSDFRSFLGNIEGLEVKKVYNIRVQLASIGKALSQLHKALADFDMGRLSEKDKKSLPLIRWLNEAELADLGHKISKIPEEVIILPFFDEHDVTIVSLLHSLFLKQGSPIHELLPEKAYAQLYVGPLDSVLAGLCNYQERIATKIKSAQEDADNMAGLPPKLPDVYKALKQFFQCHDLSKDTPPDPSKVPGLRLPPDGTQTTSIH